MDKTIIKLTFLFTTMFISSWIPSTFPYLFDDWVCNGLAYNHLTKSYEFYTHFGYKHLETETHWGFRHYLFSLFGLIVSGLQINNIFKDKTNK
jgi:hypothetical protein